jgi:hypothetical protein
VPPALPAYLDHRESLGLTGLKESRVTPDLKARRGLTGRLDRKAILARKAHLGLTVLLVLQDHQGLPQARVVPAQST